MFVLINLFLCGFASASIPIQSITRTASGVGVLSTPNGTVYLCASAANRYISELFCEEINAEYHSKQTIVSPAQVGLTATVISCPSSRLGLRTCVIANYSNSCPSHIVNIYCDEGDAEDGPTVGSISLYMAPVWIAIAVVSMSVCIGLRFYRRRVLLRHQQHNATEMRSQPLQPGIPPPTNSVPSGTSYPRQQQYSAAFSVTGFNAANYNTAYSDPASADAPPSYESAVTAK